MDYPLLQLPHGTHLSRVLYRLRQAAQANQQAILDFIQSLPEQAITGLDFLEGLRGEVMVRLQETFGATERYCVKRVGEQPKTLTIKGFWNSLKTLDSQMIVKATLIFRNNR